MKKLLKSEVCGTCEQCTVHGRKVKSSSLKKKKKKMKRVLRLDMDANAVPKQVLSSFFFLATYFVLLIITERSLDQIIEIVQFFQLWMKTYCQCLNS